MEQDYKKFRIQYVPGPNCKEKKVGTFVALPGEDKTIEIGFALCSKGDEFKKSVGRDIAIRRAHRWRTRTEYELFGGDDDYINDLVALKHDPAMVEKFLSSQNRTENYVPVNWSQKSSLIRFIKKVSSYYKGYNLPVWANKLIEEN